MTEPAAVVPRREPVLLRAVKSMALMRESVVGMIGFALVLFWVLVAIFADLIAPFPPNATMISFAAPGTRG